MLRLTTTHVRRSFAHRHDQNGGHLYQGRFKSFPVQDHHHLLTVLRYVEANPLRVGLSKRAGQWHWSSDALRQQQIDDLPLLDELPLELPDDWLKIVQSRWEKPDLEAVRTSLRRGRPFGDERWVKATAAKLGLSFTLRPRGRPPKPPLAVTRHGRKGEK
jgi:putative transposase